MKHDHRFERRMTHGAVSNASLFARTAKTLANWNPTKAESNGTAPNSAIPAKIAAIPSKRIA